MNDDLEIGIAAGLDPMTALVLSEERPRPPRQPQRPDCGCLVAVLIGLVFLLYVVFRAMF